jgi:hypothetical protein
MAKYIVTFNDQINEIEIHGFSLMTDKEVENYENLATSITWDFTYPISDSELSYVDGEDMLSRMEFKEVTNEEFKLLKKLFKEDFGIFITEDYLTDIVDDEDVVDEDEEIDEDEDDFDDYSNRKKNTRYDYDDDY